MALTLEDVTFLASATGEALLARLTGEDLGEANTLRLLTALRRDYGVAEAGAALALARLRQKAADKFGADAGHLFFTPEALEQASDPRVRRYRAAAAHGLTVVDACCGIGADSLAMAAAGGDVLGLDLDAVRVAMARLNAAALGLAARFENADVRDGLPPADMAFFDPARRDAQGRRLHNVEQYGPPLSTVRVWTQPSIRVKLSPGVDLAQLAPYGGQVEFISVDGDLKEAMLSLGGEPGMQATLLASDDVFTWRAGEAVEAALSEPRGWLLEPDAALLRAGLVTDAARAWNAAQLDETIAYLTADERPETPWMRAWRVRDWMPFGVKTLRAYLRAQSVGRVTVKKRGTAVTPESLIPQLRLKGDEARTLVLTRCRGRQIVLVCDEQPAR